LALHAPASHPERSSGPSSARLLLKCDSTRAETIFRLSAKRTSPFKSLGVSVQSTTGSRGLRISGRNAGYTMFRGSMKSTGYPLHSPVSPSIPLPCVTVCHHISTGLYQRAPRNIAQERCLQLKSSDEKFVHVRSTTFITIYTSDMIKKERNLAVVIPVIYHFSTFILLWLLRLPFPTLIHVRYLLTKDTHMSA
jgi:hypothetical protein